MDDRFRKFEEFVIKTAMSHIKNLGFDMYRYLGVEVGEYLALELHARPELIKTLFEPTNSMDDDKTYKFTDLEGRVHYLMLAELTEAEDYCPHCAEETETGTRIYRGSYDSDGAQIDPDEECFYCKECGVER